MCDTPGSSCTTSAGPPMSLLSTSVCYFCTLNHFLIFMFVSVSPRWIRGSDLVDISTDNGERDVHLFCRFRTFPESIVTWQYAPEVKADPTDVNVSRVVFADTLVQGSQPVVNGNITFIEVAYEDAGFYNCSADNGYNVTIVRLRLRVKSKLCQFLSFLTPYSFLIFHLSLSVSLTACSSGNVMCMFALFQIRSGWFSQLLELLDHL